jgi:thioredoxin-dependent peroxiredoxin
MVKSLSMLALLVLLAASRTTFSQTTESNMPDSVSVISAGMIAPDFSLPDQSGKQVHLKELRGRPVVLYFYPKDFTSGCTTEACDFRDNFGPLTKAGAIVLGVSPDAPDSHVKFIKEHNLPFTLLADSTHSVMISYGAWGKKQQYGKEFEGVIRTTVLIGADGKVAQVWPSVRVEGHVEKVLAEVQKLAIAQPK